MGEGDPHIHVDAKLHAEAATRIVLAETFGLVSDLPAEVKSGCGQRVPYAMTSARPESVTCLACRRFAARKHSEAADQAHQLRLMPGIGVPVELLGQAVEKHRELARRFSTGE